jgi:hypothetical protein
MKDPLIKFFNRRVVEESKGEKEEEYIAATCFPIRRWYVCM